ncbi:MAG TPA: hypothetical protein P5150_09915 [Candidatus Ratteibacteria bacterium]|nr:hypothetical protein [Candidatus Ratteibacteria bacterium]
MSKIKQEKEFEESGIFIIASVKLTGKSFRDKQFFDVAKIEIVI